MIEDKGKTKRFPSILQKKTPPQYSTGFDYKNFINNLIAHSLK